MSARPCAFAYGLVVTGQEDGNLLNRNTAGTWLHGGSVALGLVTALWPRHTAGTTAGALT